MQIQSIEHFNERFNQLMERDINISPNQQLKFENILNEKGVGNEDNKISKRKDLVIDSLNVMKETQVNAKSEMMNVLIGKSDNAHQALINMEKAKLQMQFATNIRDKVVNGVNQLLNMQI